MENHFIPSASSFSYTGGSVKLGHPARLGNVTVYLLHHEGGFCQTALFLLPTSNAVTCYFLDIFFGK